MKVVDEFINLIKAKEHLEYLINVYEENFHWDTEYIDTKWDDKFIKEFIRDAKKIIGYGR